MNIQLEDGSQIGVGILISVIYRTDLVPVTLKMVVKADDRLRDLLTIGRNMDFTFNITLDDTKLKKLTKDVKVLNKRHVRFGWYEGKKYPVASDNSGIPIAAIAAKHEFGLDGLTPRPYFRQAIEMVKSSNKDQIKNVMLSALHGQDTTKTLQRLSDSVGLSYKKSVMMQNMPPLSPVTVSIKGHAYQMVETGVLVDGFKSRVYKVGINNKIGQ